MLDHDNHYPRGYRVPYFILFLRGDGQSTLNHIACFTIQCGELSILDNFSNMKQRLFPNLLQTLFYLVCNSAKKFHFNLTRNEAEVSCPIFRTLPEICIAKFSRVTQVDKFIERFKG